MAFSINAKITLSKQYYSDSYDQYSRYGSRRLLVERIVGSVALVAAVILLVIDFQPDLLTFVLFLVAAVDLLGNSIRKALWLRKYSRAKELGSSVEFEFSEHGISSASKYTSGELSWEGVDKVQRTPNGILVWPTKGIYMYFPEDEVGADVIEYVQQMAP